MPTDKVTSSVDYDIKRAYEATFERGKVVFKEMIEEGMLRRIEEFDPIAASKMRIERYRRMLDEEEKKLKDLELLERMERLTPKKQKKDELEQFNLQAHRENMFLKYQETLMFQRKKKIAHDWSKIQEDFRFKSKFEAQDYIESMMTANC